MYKRQVMDAADPLGRIREHPRLEFPAVQHQPLPFGFEFTETEGLETNRVARRVAQPQHVTERVPGSPQPGRRDRDRAELAPAGSGRNRKAAELPRSDHEMCIRDRY